MAKKSPVSKIREFGFVLEERKGRLESQAMFRLWGDIDSNISYQFEQFTELVLINQIDECLVIINSHGGIMWDAVSIYENISLLQSRGVVVKTQVKGIAASGAALCFLAGNPRLMFANSRLCMHDPSLPTDEGMTRLTDAVREVETHRAIARSIQEWVSRRTGISPKEVERAFATEVYITPTEALKDGWSTELSP